MAVVSYTLTEQIEGSVKNNGTVLVSWPLMANGDTGQPFLAHSHSDKSAQITGTFGAGGNCRIEGSNDSTIYAALSDHGATALNITSASIKAVAENTRWLRPNISAGDGTTSITVTLVAKL